MPYMGNADNDEHSWIEKAGCAIVIAAVLIGAGFLGLLIWGAVEVIQLIGRLG